MLGRRGQSWSRVCIPLHGRGNTTGQNKGKKKTCALEKHMSVDKLDGVLKHRKSPGEVLKSRILHGDPSCADGKYADAIEEEYAKMDVGA